MRTERTLLYTLTYRVAADHAPSRRSGPAMEQIRHGLVYLRRARGPRDPTRTTNAAEQLAADVYRPNNYPAKPAPDVRSVDVSAYNVAARCCGTLLRHAMKQHAMKIAGL